MSAGSIDCLWISGIRMPDDAQPWIGSQDTLQASGCFWSAIGDDYLAGMLTETNSHPTAMVKGDPGCASNRVDQGIQDGPITHRI